MKNIDVWYAKEYHLRDFALQEKSDTNNASTNLRNLASLILDLPGTHYDVLTDTIAQHIEDLIKNPYCTGILCKDFIAGHIRGVFEHLANN